MQIKNLFEKKGAVCVFHTFPMDSLLLCKTVFMEILLLTGILAYLLGSFNAAYWFGKWFHNIDIREHGSKNAGATNLLRVVGWKAALPAFLTDALKAFVAVKLSLLQTLWLPGSEALVIWQIALGAIAVSGHIFPLYSGFRGGKGVASLLGVVLALHPLAALFSLAVFVVVMLISRIVSLASMIAGVSFPLVLICVLQEERVSMIVFSVLAAVLLLISHRKNLKRLLNKEEKRISFK